MDKYHLDISLSRWVMVQYSSNIWRRPEMRGQIFETILSPSMIMQMPSDLLEELDRLTLPGALKNELKFAVGSMGTTLCKWLYGCMENDYNYLRYTDHIHWTHLGSIDIPKTVKSLYMSGYLPITYGTWNILRECCVEECIIMFREEVWNCDEYNELKEEICCEKILETPLVIYWRLRAICDFTDEQRVIDYMAGCRLGYEAFTFFWNRISDEKKKSILKTASSDPSCDDRLTRMSDRNIDFFMFSIQQYSLYGFHEVLIRMLASSDVVQNMLIWPCQSDLMSVLEESCNNGNYFEYEGIISAFLHLMHLERSYIGNDTKTRRLFCDVWTNKHGLKFKGEITEASFRYIFDTADVNSLKFIMTHATSQEERKKWWNFIGDVCMFDSEVIDEVSWEGDIREWFHQKLEDMVIDENEWCNEE